MYHLVFIITCTNDLNINNCIESISIGNKSVKLLCLILLQNNIKLSLDKYITDYTDIKVFNIDNIIALSKARNLLLSSHSIIPSAYYMFPDDDSLFDNLFFDRFEHIISQNTLIAVKATQDKKTFFLKMPHKSIATISDYAKAISVNMIIKGSVIENVGGFDENLGVGNYYGAGEDNDYFIRCNKIESFTFSNDIWNYHPLQQNISLPVSKLIARYKSYGRGVVYMLLKHRMYGAAFKVIFRGYAGAILNLISLNIKKAYVYFIAANTRLYVFFQNL